MEDAKIIELFFQRNEQAVKETDTAYGRKLYVLSNNILNNREDAQECVSDTYMETWKSIPPKRPKYFYAFLASICRNMSFNRLDWQLAEKQCAGAYLGDTICEAWQTAAAEGLLPAEFRAADWSLAEISAYMAREESAIPPCDAAKELAFHQIRRAAKVAAILCAGPMLLAANPGQVLRVAVEGSQYWRLTGFRELFHRELDALLSGRDISYEIVRSENACLIGAATAAFAKPM